MHNLFRPKNLSDFIGQEKLKATLKIMISSSKKQKKHLDHILLVGPPGMGKTSLAITIAHELNANTRFMQGPLLEKKSDVLSLLASLTNNDVLFIDEIHGINKNVEEILYSAMEDGVIDIMLGPDGDSKIVRMKLPSFTLIGATTKNSQLSNPLKDRFGLIGKIFEYTENEIKQIVQEGSKKIKLNIDEESTELIASYSRLNPRIALNLLKRIQDYAIAKEKESVSKRIVEKAFKSLGLYKFGLTDMHVGYLKFLFTSFKNTWISLETIANIIHESKENIEVEIEPLLLKHFLIEKSSRGRKISFNGIEYIKNILV